MISTTHSRFATLETTSDRSRASGRPDQNGPSTAKRLGSLTVCGLGLAFLASCGSSGSDSDDASGVDPTTEPAVVAVPGQTDVADEPLATDSSSDPAPEASAAVSAPAPVSAGAGTGMIQIGEVRHDLTITRCMDLFGAITGGAVSVTEPENVDVSFDFSPEDWNERASEGWVENGTIRLDSEDPYLQWETGRSQLELFTLPDGLEYGDVDITSYDISDDLQSVSGEAQFIELNAMLSGATSTPTSGSFSFSCPPAD